MIGLISIGVVMFFFSLIMYTKSLVELNESPHSDDKWGVGVILAFMLMVVSIGMIVDGSYGKGVIDHHLNRISVERVDKGDSINWEFHRNRK